MRKATDAKIELARAVRELRYVVRELLRALYTHARTDLAPDACLPRLEALIDRIAAGAQPRRPRRGTRIPSGRRQ